MRSICKPNIEPSDYVIKKIRSKKKYKDYYKNFVIKRITPYIEEYNSNFLHNSLEKTKKHEFDLEMLEFLLSLYNYKNFMKSLIEDNGDHEIAYCPLCDANEVDSFDHYLPKKQFPEFSVHPWNLIPCCSKCNRFKKEVFLNNDGIRFFFNVYLDQDINEQYLFCDIEFNNNFPYGKYYIDESAVNNNQQFALIISTYNTLKLIDRYNKLDNETNHSVLLKVEKIILIAIDNNINNINNVVDKLLVFYNEEHKKALNDREIIFSLALLNSKKAVNFIVEHLRNKLCNKENDNV